MISTNAIEKKIVDTLKDSVWGLTAVEIAQKAGINRMTSSKYLEILKVKKIVKDKQVGVYRVWLLTKETEQRLLSASREYLRVLGSAITDCFGKKAFNVAHDLGKASAKYFIEKKEKMDFLTFVSKSALGLELFLYGVKTEHEVSKAKGTIRVYNCLCSGNVKSKPMCVIQLGAIEEIGRLVGCNVKVKETRCMCDGEKFCEFEIVLRGNENNVGFSS